MLSCTIIALHTPHITLHTPHIDEHVSKILITTHSNTDTFIILLKLSVLYPVILVPARFASGTWSLVLEATHEVCQHLLFTALPWKYININIKSTTKSTTRSSDTRSSHTRSSHTRSSHTRSPDTRLIISHKIISHRII